MDYQVILNEDQGNRYLKVLRAKDPAPVAPGLDKDDKPLPAPKARTNAELIQDNLFGHVKGAVLYTERQAASSSVKEF